MTRIDYMTTKKDNQTMVITLVLVNNENGTLLHLIKDVQVDMDWKFNDYRWKHSQVQKLVTKLIATYLTIEYPRQFATNQGQRFLSELNKYGHSYIFDLQEVDRQMILILFGKIDIDNRVYDFDIDDYYGHDHYEFNF